MNEVVIASRRYISREYKIKDLELPLMELKAVAMATNNFSYANKIGQGGFGIVYKVKVIQNLVKKLSLHKVLLYN